MKKRYSNLDQVENVKSFKDLRQWRTERKSKQKDLSYVVPHAETSKIDFLRENRSETTITWIGHSTFLIQSAGLNIVTDPVWAERMGFEKRHSAPGVPIEQLPDIDIVMISHSHYDHLHFSSIRKLKGNPVILVPVGLRTTMLRKGFRRVEQLAWWDSVTIGELEITFVPAQHWTRRTLWDMNSSHWGGWVVCHSAAEVEGVQTIYFAGDSGYFRGFKQIGQRFAVDVALMPIGAYEPEWFMSTQHVSPEEAVQAFEDLNAQTFIPMHYGAFRLADDTPKEALDRLYKAWSERGLDPLRLQILKLGEVFTEKR